MSCHEDNNGIYDSHTQYFLYAINQAQLTSYNLVCSFVVALHNKIVPLQTKFWELYEESNASDEQKDKALHKYTIDLINILKKLPHADNNFINAYLSLYDDFESGAWVGLDMNYV